MRLVAKFFASAPAIVYDNEEESFNADIPQNHSKLDHGLVSSYLQAKDRQNMNACDKICSESVLNLLFKTKHASGTFIYLLLMRFLIYAFIDRRTAATERISYAWTVAFFIRFWRAWLDTTNKILPFKQRSKHFITASAYHSIEINCHFLIYIQMLVINKTLPSSAINIYLFSSQPCEGLFRLTRSMSGTFQSVVNFSVKEFLDRAHKLTVLMNIKTTEAASGAKDKLYFPQHHKQKTRIKDNQIIEDDISKWKAKVIENIVLDAFKQAKLMLKKVGIYHEICLQHLDTIQNLSHFISERSRKRLLTETITTLESDLSDDEEAEQNNQDELIDTHSHTTTTANHENIERTDFKNMK
ncbi:unnamed protein product, partial [Didymodactylos carnosus]